METEKLNYTLPDELIAQHPCEKREQSRLLVLNRAASTLEDKVFADLGGYLQEGDCLVLNNTKVLAARFYARRMSGAQLEGLFIRQEADGCWQVLIKNARKLKSGETIQLLDRSLRAWETAVVRPSNIGGQWLLRPDCDCDAFGALERIGLAPLPPYIRRMRSETASACEDLQRYQTVYAQHPGAVAAPTAGLHFNQAILKHLETNGIKLAYVTLHVGIGTFRPVQTATLDEHPMHEEHYDIDGRAADIINQTADRGGRIVAVGTTSVRTLESVAQNRHVEPKKGKTALFIQPGYRFQIVDAMVTNFHLPKSTLLALVGAFAGLDTVLKAYQHAIEQRYRFYSYGDAMLIY